MSAFPDVASIGDWLSGTKPFLRLPDASDPDLVIETLRDQEIDAQAVDLAGVVDKSALLQTLHQALEFGDWFGFNWDALEDALHGPEDRAARDRVLVVSGLQALRAHAPADAEIFLDIVQTVAETSGSGLRGCVLIG